MRTAGPALLIAIVLVTSAVAYFARFTIYDLIVLPTAYFLWRIQGLLATVAQLILWGILVTVTALVTMWQLVPRLRPNQKGPLRPPFRDGPVHATAVHLLRARKSNYFRWQLAHRLARATRELGGLYPDDAAGQRPDVIAAYLDAGTNHSFVEYSSGTLPFRRRAAGPLDLDPAEAVTYLESRFAHSGDGNANRS